MTPKQFESLARRIMSDYYKTELREKDVRPRFPKRFDMVSNEATVVGDAKYLTLVRGKALPAAKFMEIAGHMWLLQHTNAKSKFLVFGNQREVPERWIRKYGGLIEDVRFFFLTDQGNLDLMTSDI